MTVPKAADMDFTPDELRAQVMALREEMRTAAEDLDFERAAEIRDRIKSLEEGALLAGYEAGPRVARAPKPKGRGGRGRR